MAVYIDWRSSSTFLLSAFDSKTIVADAWRTWRTFGWSGRRIKSTDNVVDLQITLKEARCVDESDVDVDCIANLLNGSQASRTIVVIRYVPVQHVERARWTLVLRAIASVVHG